MSGGIKQGVGFLGLGSAGVEFSTEQAGWWKGGTFAFSGATTHGIAAQEQWIGDYQAVTNIDAGGSHIYLESLLFTQEFEHIEFGVGLQGYDDILGVNDHGGLFLNASFGLNPVTNVNAGVATFPLTALGVTATWHVNEHFSYTVAAYDTPLNFDEDNEYNTNWKVGENGYTLATELAYVPFIGDNELRGAYKVATFYQTKGYNWGIHCSAEQEVYKQGEHALALFAIGAFAPDEDNNEMKAYVGGGMHYTGLFSKEGKDEIGFAVSSATFDLGFGKETETTLEMSYQYKLNEHFYLQPDLQYVINPNGGSVDNDFVGIVRFGIEF